MAALKANAGLFDVLPLDSLPAMIWHYAHSIERRLFLLEEMSRLERAGREFPNGFRRRIWKSPSWAEDWINLLCFLNPGEPVILLDVGANVGEFSDDFLKIFRHAKILALEPTSAPFELLESRFRSNSNVTCLQYAASSEHGLAAMKVGVDSVYSSFEEYTADANIRSRNKISAEEQVTKVRIDCLDLPDEADVLVLKVDVQGHEFEALKGAEKLLPHVSCCLVEASFSNEFRDREPSFSPVCGLMRDAGLYPVVFQDYGYGTSSYGHERDVLFVKDRLLPRVWHHNY